MMHVQQSTGRTRQEAAEWVVRHISPTLAARISEKPLTPRVVGADSEEKREPVSDIDTVVMDGLKALDPDQPIREAEILPNAPAVLISINADIRSGCFHFEMCLPTSHGAVAGIKAHFTRLIMTDISFH